MKQFGFTRLSTKMLTVFLFILGSTLVGLFSVIEFRDFLVERRALIADLHELTKIESPPIAAALWEFDIKKINSFLVEAGRLEFVQGAVVTDQMEKIIAQIGDLDTPPKSPEFVSYNPLVFRYGETLKKIGSLKIIAHDQQIFINVMNRLKKDVIILVVLLVVVSGTTYLATKRIIGRPLTLLHGSIEQIRHGGKREQVEWVSTDELGQVVAAYNEMQLAQEKTEEELRNAHDGLEVRVEERTRELSHARDQAETTLIKLRQTQAELETWQKRVGRELEYASEIQKAFLPNFLGASFPIYAECISARELSGDFFDVINLDGQRVFFCLGDVSGKGVHAAVVMAQSISLFRVLSRREVLIEDVLLGMNATLSASGILGMFVTVVGGELNLRSGGLRLVNAGHEPALLHRGEGDFETIPATAPPLGIDPNLRRDQLNPREIELNGSTLYLFSDGVTQQKLKQGGELGVEGLKEFLVSCRNLPLQERVTTVLEKILTQSDDRHDDMTLMVVDFAELT